MWKDEGKLPTIGKNSFYMIRISLECISSKYLASLYSKQHNTKGFKKVKKQFTLGLKEEKLWLELTKDDVYHWI